MAQRSALRNFLTHGFHLLVMLVVGSQIRDTPCGFTVRLALLTSGAGVVCVCGGGIE